MFMCRTTEDGRGKDTSKIAIHHSRQHLALLLFLLLSPTNLCETLRSKIAISRGPTTGIVTQEIPNPLMTDHRVISQTIYVDLDIEGVLRRSFSLAEIHDPAILMWYQRHLERSKDSIREILSQAEKSIIVQKSPSNARPRRAIGSVIMGIMALLTVVGTVIGSTMNAVNSVSIKTVQRKNTELQAAIKDIQLALAIQRDTNVHLVKVIKDTVVVTNLQTARLEHSIRLHEQASLQRQLFYQFVEPILFLTDTYLRQLEMSIHNLLQAHIPLYLVDVFLVRTALAALHGPELDSQQIRIAFETGTAIPMYIDTERLHISFLLNIPLVRPEKIYQLKRVINVGTWEGNTKTKINSPELIAYQNNSDAYLIPQLQSCLVFKDQNYLCPGNPFSPVQGGFLCGLEGSTSDNTLCDVTVTRSSDIMTEAVLINNMWLVSTNAPNMTVTYIKHGTFAVRPITYSTFTVVVPKDVIISVGSENLFYVNVEDLPGGMEMVNTFKPFSIPQDADLDLLLDKKKSHSLQLLLKQDNISISDMKFSSEDSSHLESLEFMTQWAQVVWSSATTIWLLLVTVLILIHNKFILQVIKVVRQRQREIELNIV